jgi:hypothetical protein
MLRGIYSTIYGEVNISVTGGYVLQYAGGTRASRTCCVELLQCQKVEYRTVIKFLSKEGFAPSAIKQYLDDIYGETSSYSTIKEWAKQFHLGRETVEVSLVKVGHWRC